MLRFDSIVGIKIAQLIIVYFDLCQRELPEFLFSHCTVENGVLDLEFAHLVPHSVLNMFLTWMSLYPLFVCAVSLFVCFMLYKYMMMTGWQ